MLVHKKKLQLLMSQFSNGEGFGCLNFAAESHLPKDSPAQLLWSTVLGLGFCLLPQVEGLTRGRKFVQISPATPSASQTSGAMNHL